jgi:hypothetical protein
VTVSFPGSAAPFNVDWTSIVAVCRAKVRSSAALPAGSTSMTDPVTIRSAPATSSVIGSAGSVAWSPPSPGRASVVVSGRIGCSS